VNVSKKELKCRSVFEPEKSRLGSGREWDDDDSEGGIGLDGEFVEEEVENDAFDVGTVSWRSSCISCLRWRGQMNLVDAKAGVSLSSLHGLTAPWQAYSPSSTFQPEDETEIRVFQVLEMTLVSMYVFGYVCVYLSTMYGCATTTPTTHPAGHHQRSKTPHYDSFTCSRSRRRSDEEGKQPDAEGLDRRGGQREETQDVSCTRWWWWWWWW
jgi:hypothetical protein